MVRCIGVPARVHLISSSPKTFLILDGLSFPFTSEPLAIPTATTHVPRSAARNLSTICDPIGSSQLASVPARCPSRGSLLVVRYLQSTNLRRSSSCPPDQLQPQDVPDPRRPKLPVHIRAARDPDCNSSRSPISRLQPQHHLRPDRKQPARVRSSSLSISRFSLGGPVSTIY
ncbi:hypothetical protein DY000_02034986 [Brassica cretica]|uniref:Uncharacterized protein n=1 Tax=Brassica cretica TaxID=69181 RepID=A0ABQ7DLX3_BRACR|nr:hypothetical protein DY000_02034986 [Brassica cretica]